MSLRTQALAAALLAMTMPLAPSTAHAGPAVAAAWKSFDGTAFPVLKWLPVGAGQPEATIVCLHGLSGAADDFEQLGERLSAAGNAVYAYNLRGQGNDPKKRRVGDIRRREHWFADLDSFISHTRTLHPDTPVFIYGESLGSLIVMHGFDELSDANRNAVRGLIYGSPVVALPGELPPFKNFIVKALIRICPGFRVSLLRLAGSHDAQVTADAGHDHWDQMRKTPHFVEYFTFRMLGTIESMVKSSTDAAAPIEKPVLVLYPGKDVFTKPEQVEAFYKPLESTDKSKRLFAESHHLLFYDDEREELFKVVREWVDDRS